jgi:hypothetical protein
VVILGLVALDLLMTWRNGFDAVTKYEPLIVPAFIAVCVLTMSIYVARSQRVRATFNEDWEPPDRPSSVLPLSAAS